MKTLDLNAYGVQEMNAVEMKETDGGLGPVPAFLIGAVVGGVFYDTVKATYIGYFNLNQQAHIDGVYNGMPSRSLWK